MGKAIQTKDTRSDRSSSASDTVGLYLDEVSSHLLLTAEDEVHLARAMELGKKAKSNLDEAEKYCPGAVCTDPRGVTAGNDAHSAGNVSTIAMIIGAAGIAGGITLWFTAPRENATAARLELGVGRVGVGGTF